MFANQTQIGIPFANLKDAALRAVKDSPQGIRQSDVAKALGIPSQFDHNWITKSLLDGLVKEGKLTKTDSKLFLEAA